MSSKSIDMSLMAINDIHNGGIRHLEILDIQIKSIFNVAVVYHFGFLNFGCGFGHVILIRVTWQIV